MSQKHLSRLFFPASKEVTASLSGRPAMDHLAGEKNILRISVRAIIYDDRLAPAGQTSGVGTETGENERKDNPEFRAKNDTSLVRGLSKL
jgi:hypothetical protein